MKKKVLNQVIALLSGKKTRSQKDITSIHHRLKKSDLFSGLVKEYQSADEEGATYPTERKRVQYTVKEAVSEAVDVWVDLINVAATQDYANTSAKADVVVDDVVIARQVPVTQLLFLEKQLNDLHTFVSKLPILDDARDWYIDGNTGLQTSDVVVTNKTRKVPKTFVKYDATPEHPAQVDVFTEDVKEGEWHTKYFSGAISAVHRKNFVDRVLKLQEAVKVAREEANNIEVDDVEIGQPILDYIFR